MLPGYGVHPQEHFSWRKIVTCVDNLIVGPQTLDHYGELEVTNPQTGSKCIITFPKPTSGWFSKGDLNNNGNITGIVQDSHGTTKLELEGNWMDHLYLLPQSRCPYPNEKVYLWKRNPLPENAEVNFNMTEFALLLNQTSPSLEAKLPMTDCRRRPDQRFMEQSNWKEADRAKDELENRQRSERKRLVARYEETKEPFGPTPMGIAIGEDWWTPRWFSRQVDADTQEETWVMRPEYWEIRSKETIEWPSYVGDIFGLVPSVE